MNLKSLVKIKYGSIRRCAMAANIPYMTLNDLCNEKTDIYACSSKTVYQLAKVLDMSMEDLVSEGDIIFFRNTLHNELHVLGDLKFIMRKLESDQINRLWNRDDRARALYLLAMTDYICERNNLPLAKEYDEYRAFKLENPIFFSAKAKVDDCIKNFVNFNIYEGDIDDAI